ncbi:hypothetical protein [Burkholderia vietnamiensis]|uniref:hypothetical protein n=1 Tax=Burkholderia vietnamiensis TaxID=60552 RepID=UPI001B9209DD|nr:hypothetical protein [Burkholderia vietnamiensis]MBR8032435.1 hypothetical protein [Burkholderia vietnamiensis]
MTQHTRFTIRCTVPEKAELEVRSGGDISKYVRAVLFEGQSDELLAVESRVSELIETVRVLGNRQARTSEEVRELIAKVVAAPKAKAEAPTATGTPDPATQGMLLELLLLLRGTRSRTDLDRAQAEVERQKLPVWDGPTPPSSWMASSTTEQRPKAEVERQDTPVRDERKQGGWLGDWRKK